MKPKGIQSKIIKDGMILDTLVFKFRYWESTRSKNRNFRRYLGDTYTLIVIRDGGGARTYAIIPPIINKTVTRKISLTPKNRIKRAPSVI